MSIRRRGRMYNLGEMIPRKEQTKFTAKLPRRQLQYHKLHASIDL
jgi:hypothetical protein